MNAPERAVAILLQDFHLRAAGPEGNRGLDGLAEEYAQTIAALLTYAPAYKGDAWARRLTEAVAELTEQLRAEESGRRGLAQIHVPESIHAYAHCPGTTDGRHQWAPAHPVAGMAMRCVVCTATDDRQRQAGRQDEAGRQGGAKCARA